MSIFELVHFGVKKNIHFDFRIKNVKKNIELFRFQIDTAWFRMRKAHKIFCTSPLHRNQLTTKGNYRVSQLSGNGMMETPTENRARGKFVHV